MRYFGRCVYGASVCVWRIVRLQMYMLKWYQSIWRCVNVFVYFFFFGRIFAMYLCMAYCTCLSRQIRIRFQYVKLYTHYTCKEIFDYSFIRTVVSLFLFSILCVNFVSVLFVWTLYETYHKFNSIQFIWEFQRVVNREYLLLLLFFFYCCFFFLSIEF